MKFFKEFGMPVIVLMVICLVVTSALALAYNKTQPIIETNKKAEADKTRTEVLTDADSFSKIDLELPQGAIDAYQADNGSGYVITTSYKGYGGDVEIMIGISSEGKVVGLKAMDNKETPGFGSRVLDKENLDKAIGKDENLEGVEDIAGVTYTSTALRQDLKIAFDVYNKINGGESK